MEQSCWDFCGCAAKTIISHYWNSVLNWTQNHASILKPNPCFDVVVCLFGWFILPAGWHLCFENASSFSHLLSPCWTTCDWQLLIQVIFVSKALLYKKNVFTSCFSVFQALTVRWDTLSCLHFRNWESRRPSGWFSLEMFSANLGSSHFSSWLFSSSTLTSCQPQRIASGWTHFSWTPLKIKIWWQNWFK